MFVATLIAVVDRVWKMCEWMMDSCCCYLTLHEVQSRHAVPRQRCVEAPAHLTRDIFANILSQQGLDVFRHELSSNDQTLVAIDRALGT
jgi:hypothetical protein